MKKLECNRGNGGSSISSDPLNMFLHGPGEKAQIHRGSCEGHDVQRLGLGCACKDLNGIILKPKD